MATKGELQRLRVIESASYCLTHFGERGTTFQSIAEHCKISQASVVKYLKNKDNIFPTVLEFWISRARNRTEAALLKDSSPAGKLKHYLKVSIELFHETHEISIIMLTLQYLAGVNEKYRVINSEIKNTAQRRIAGIIDEGISDGTFKKVNSQAAAKTIHNCLMGYLLGSVTEVKQPSDLKLPEMLTQLCLDLVSQ